jgi:hypothetical protein
MIRQYARLMAHARQNMFWIPLTNIVRRTARGLVLDRPRLERLVKLFTGEGLWFIEGGHLGQRHKREWNAEYFDLVPDGPRATSPEGNAEIANISRQLMQVIRENKWQDRWIQHVTDEPTAENAVDYRIFVGMAHKYMPGLPILDATMDVTLAGSVDIWCPQVQEYQRHRREFSGVQKLGDKVYFYTCCCPGGPWLNRLLDMELLRPALFGWAAARFALDGFLHWGFNYWQPGQDPFQMNNIPWPPGDAPKPNCLPAGDTHICYPGSDGPWSSVRLEAQREGFEDYELLKTLGEKNRAALQRVSGRAIRAFDRYARDVSVYRRARRALLEATQ